MKDITHHIQEATKDIRLTDLERTHVLSVISEYKKMKPIRESQKNYARGFSFALFLRPIAAALILFVATGSGISYAAEDALPGDMLYPVKTSVTEPLRLALASDAEEKASVQIALAERRIAEAAELAAENKLDEPMQEKLATAFEAHVSVAAAHIEEVDAEDASKSVALTSTFETRLAARESVLARVQHEKTEEPTRLSDAIRSAGATVASIRTRSEEKLAVSSSRPDTASLSIASLSLEAPAPETTRAASNTGESTSNMAAAKRMRSSAELQLKKAQKSLGNSKLNAEARSQADSELELARQQIEEGKHFLKTNEAALAFHAFQQSLITSEKIDVIARSSQTLAKAKPRDRDRSDDEDRTRSLKEAPDASSAAGTEIQALSIPASTSALIDTATSASLTLPQNPLPPSAEIFTPVQNTLKGLIRGASTSKEKYQDDEDEDGARKGENDNND